MKWVVGAVVGFFVVIVALMFWLHFSGAWR